MKPYKWRTRNNNYVYVDSATGSDIFGDGTQQNPYQSLGKAWRGHSINHPSMIVCRGTFSEDMADGTHSTTIQGDYYGAATFDGHGIYTLYGFTTPNMVFVNCAYGTYDAAVSSASALFAGVGRAFSAGSVGSAAHVFGVAASSVLLRASALYWGAIGGNRACVQVGVVSPTPNPHHLFWFATDNGAEVRSFSVYDVPRQYRNEVQRASGNKGTFAGSLFGKVAFMLNDRMIFKNCSFANDCTWWNGDEEFVPTGDTPDERMASLQQWIADTQANDKIELQDCRLLSRNSYEIWNNPDGGDLTLRFENCDEELLNPEEGYRGAFPPALNIPILSDSQGIPNSWDETTACGIISVANDKIVIGGDDGSGETEGEIKSKIIVTNPNAVAISGIFAQYANQMQSAGILLTGNKVTGASYSAGDILPTGRYRISGGSITYGGVYLATQDVLVVTEDGTSFESDALSPTTATVRAIEDANEIDNMWLRSSNRPLFIRAVDGLQAGGQYVNVYGKPITYRGRTIVNGESFEAANNEDTFTCEGDADYRIAAVFDDSRVPTEPWIPAQLWGAYFAGKLGLAYQKDSEGNYLGSGNYLSWIPKSEGGYSDEIRKTAAQARYIQLRIKATKV